jgi:hypothetical protein
VHQMTPNVPPRDIVPYVCKCIVAVHLHEIGPTVVDILGDVDSRASVNVLHQIGLAMDVSGDGVDCGSKVQEIGLFPDDRISTKLAIRKILLQTYTQVYCKFLLYNSIFST